MLLHQKGHYKEGANRLIGVVLDPVLAVHYETAFGKYWVPGISQVEQGFFLLFLPNLWHI